MAIKDVLIPELERRFHESGMRLNQSSGPFAIIPAISPEVGDVEVWDDGIEATVVIKNITHGHFGCWDSDKTSEHVAEYVSASVADFLSDLFADRILLWVAHNGRSGGWSMLDKESPSLRPNARNYLWSGPISTMP